MTLSGAAAWRAGAARLREGAPVRRPQEVTTAEPLIEAKASGGEAYMVEVHESSNGDGNDEEPGSGSDNDDDDNSDAASAKKKSAAKKTAESSAKKGPAKKPARSRRLPRPRNAFCFLRC